MNEARTRIHAPDGSPLVLPSMAGTRQRPVHTVRNARLALQNALWDLRHEPAGSPAAETAAADRNALVPALAAATGQTPEQVLARAAGTG